LFVDEGNKNNTMQAQLNDILKAVTDSDKRMDKRMTTNNLVSFMSFAVSFNDIVHTIGDWSSKGIWIFAFMFWAYSFANVNILYYIYHVN
jgi:hypothetical protein